jgi:hemoglobin
MTNVAEESYYQRIGGIDAIRVAVDRLYQLILNDPSLQPYFVGVDMPRQRAHMAAMLAKVLGGPDGYGGRDLDDAHVSLAITREHYARVCAYVVAVLTNLGVDADIVTSVSATLAGVESQIVPA